MTRTSVSALALSIAIAALSTAAHAAPLQIEPGVDFSHCGKVDLTDEILKDRAWTHHCNDGTMLFLKFGPDGNAILAQAGGHRTTSLQPAAFTAPIGHTLDEMAPSASTSAPANWMNLPLDLSRASAVGCGSFNPQQLMANKSQRCNDGSFIGFVPGTDAQGQQVAVLKRSMTADLSGAFMVGQAAGSHKPATPAGVDPAHFVCYQDQDPNYQACTSQTHPDQSGRMVADAGAHYTRYTLDGPLVGGTQMASNGSNGLPHMQNRATVEQMHVVGENGSTYDALAVRQPTAAEQVLGAGITVATLYGLGQAAKASRCSNYQRC